MAVAVALGWAGATAAESRVWTRKADGRTLTAEFTGYDKDTGEVTLRLASGKNAKISLATLSEADREWVEETGGATAEVAKEGRYEEITVPDVDVGRGVVYYPSRYDPATAAKMPVCILFDSGGNSKVLVDTLRPAADELGWLLVGLDIYSNDRFTNLGFKPLFDLTETAVEHVLDTLEHDKSKVFFGGMSGGGLHAYRCSAFVYQKAAGILAFGGWLSKNHDYPYAKGMHVAIINGDQDTEANNWIEADRECLEKLRCKVKVFDFPGGHVIAPPAVATEAVRWIHQERKLGP